MTLRPKLIELFWADIVFYILILVDTDISITMTGNRIHNMASFGKYFGMLFWYSVKVNRIVVSIIVATIVSWILIYLYSIYWYLLYNRYLYNHDWWLPFIIWHCSANISVYNVDTPSKLTELLSVPLSLLLYHGYWYTYMDNIIVPILLQLHSDTPAKVIRIDLHIIVADIVFWYCIPVSV